MISPPHAKALLFTALIGVLAVGPSVAKTQTPGPTQTPEPTLTIDNDGAAHATGVAVPISNLLSPQGKAAMAAKMHQPLRLPFGVTVADLRTGNDGMQKEILAKWRAIYPVDIAPARMNGVQTDVLTPSAGIAPENTHRVLINVHGGGFFVGARFGGQAESAPVAGRGRIKVVTVDYRMAPEAIFPAASEDVEKVYVELLKTYKPEEIGIYGCSAGGALTAQATAWLQSRRLPRPGAIGVFCSGLSAPYWYGGDSEPANWVFNGVQPPKFKGPPKGTFRPYLTDADKINPLASPGLDPKVLAQFPPTLLVTSTRDVAMSSVLVSNIQLQEAGVETQLLVLEGLGHGQFNDFAGTPESMQAYDLIWRFFDRHLAR